MLEKAEGVDGGAVASRGVEGVEANMNVADAEDPDGEDLGERQPRPGHRPNTLTKAEIEEHFPNHAHYRSWCPDCCAGRSISRQHRKRDPVEEPLGPTISLDYAFLHEGEEEDGVEPVLVAVDQIKHSVWALQVDRKGVDTGAGVEWLVGRLK